MSKLPSIQYMGTFSVDSDGEFHNDCREKKYLWSMYREEGPLKLNITATQEQVDQKNRNEYIYRYDKEYNSHLLQWIREKNYSLKDIDFVCNRNLLIKVMEKDVTNTEKPVKVCAVKEGDVIHMHILPCEEPKVWDDSEMSELVFERMLFFKRNDDGDAEVQGESFERTDSAFMWVHRAEVGEFKLLYKAEIHGVEEKPERAIQAKTSYYESHIPGGIPENTLLHWWNMMYFGHIDTIICGFRNTRGRRYIVTSLKHYRVEDLENELGRLGNQLISRCVNNLQSFLGTVKEEMNARPARQPICFEWREGNLHDVQTRSCDCLTNIIA